MAVSLESVLAAELQNIVAAKRWRQRRIVEPRVGMNPTAVWADGRECINFCSNDYLGLSAHPEIRAAFVAAVNRYGSGAGASHLVTGHGPEHEALEEELAQFTGRPRALLFSTGYMANLSIASAIVRREDQIFEDRLNHASLLDAGRLSGAGFHRYAHASPDDLLQRLIATPAAPGHRRVVVTDGVFSMDGDMAPLKELIAVCSEQDAWLMVDDAHGFGVMGKHGRGSLEVGDADAAEVPIYMATLGKALGTFGAFIAGSATLIDFLINRARTYIYTTALPPAVAAASRAALRLIQREAWRRERLNAHIERFRRGAAQLGLKLLPSQSAIQPLILGTEETTSAASAVLLDAGFLVMPIRPPTVPAGTSRLRITLSTAHETADIDRLLDALAALPASS